MKRYLSLAVILAIAMALVLPATVLAADPTTVTINWSGGGIVAGGVTAGNDATHNFAVNANASTGTFNATNYSNNPYGYNVDSTMSNFNTTITNGGIASYIVNRTDSCPSYGAAGQHSFSGISANDGTVAMGMYTVTNYASMGEQNYGHPEGWVAGNQFTANSSSFQLGHQVWDSEGDTAYFSNLGSGTANISCMSSDLGAGSLTFGKGAGCYTKADFSGNGVQNLTFFSQGHSSVSQFGFNVPGNGTAGSATLQTIINFNGAFSTPNPSTGPGFSADVN